MSTAFRSRSVEVTRRIHRLSLPRESGAGYFNTTKAADFLGIVPRTLERHRLSGTGPLFMRFGRCVWYHPDDLRAWAETHKYRSTSEPTITLAHAIPRVSHRA